MDPRQEPKAEHIFANINDFLNKTINELNNYIKNHLEIMRNKNSIERKNILDIAKSIYRFANLDTNKLDENLDNYLKISSIHLLGIQNIYLPEDQLAIKALTRSPRRFKGLVEEIKSFNKDNKEGSLIKLSGRSINAINHGFRDLRASKRGRVPDIAAVNVTEHIETLFANTNGRNNKLKPRVPQRSFILLEITFEDFSPSEVLDDALKKGFSSVEVFSSINELKNWIYQNQKRGNIHVVEADIGKSAVQTMLNNKNHLKLCEHLTSVKTNDTKPQKVKFEDNQFKTLRQSPSLR